MDKQSWLSREKIKINSSTKFVTLDNNTTTKFTFEVCPKLKQICEIFHWEPKFLIQFASGFLQNF